MYKLTVYGRMYGSELTLQEAESKLARLCYTVKGLGLRRVRACEMSALQQVTVS
jgi:hypothetical protein